MQICPVQTTFKYRIKNLMQIYIFGVLWSNFYSQVIVLNIVRRSRMSYVHGLTHLSYNCQRIKTFFFILYEGAAFDGQKHVHTKRKQDFGDLRSWNKKIHPSIARNVDKCDQMACDYCSIFGHLHR